MNRPGFRRRILIEPGPGAVTAELEDDYHRMVVTLTHRDGIVTAIDSEMKRAPWTTCPGAMTQLRATFVGHALAAFAKRGEKTRNCTHLHDLALFAAAHVGHDRVTAYDIAVSDPVAGVAHASLVRDGVLVLSWSLEGDQLIDPPPLAGRRLGDLGDWIAQQDAAGQEAARILRWASILAFGRAIDMPAGLSATAFPGGSCFTFQPDMAAVATRRPGADRNFGGERGGPLADRAAAFRPVSGDRKIV